MKRAVRGENAFGIDAWESRIRFCSDDEKLPQNEEWCQILEGSDWKRLRFHDYAEIYRHHGLYEHLFYGLLRCRSPDRVVGLLDEVIQEAHLNRRTVRALDLGAGNGIVGEHLRERGIQHMLGVDIIPEAEQALDRDRPGVYDDYVVGDLTQPTPQLSDRVRAFGPNCLVCVAALGFGDIPPLAYYNALSFIPDGGLVAFNIKAEFIDARYSHGFSELIRRMVQDKVIRVEATRRYCHRLDIRGEPLFYVAMVATKLKTVPESMLVDP